LAWWATVSVGNLSLTLCCRSNYLSCFLLSPITNSFLANSNWLHGGLLFGHQNGHAFSQSWEKSFSLRLKNDAMIDQLVAEKNASIAANVAKSEFIATASHDLRQPMQSINIFVDMIDAKNLPEYENRVFARMRNSIAVLNNMFNTLLDISKLDSGVSPQNIEFSIAQLAHDLEVGFSDLCKEKNLSFTVKHQNIFAKGDPQLLEQILRNLLFNAIQYTDAGSIVVAFDNEQGHLKFSVKDSGHGIPAEDLPVIFKEFFALSTLDHITMAWA